MTSLSRLEKLGTIFTRVRDLIRAGVMKETDKPLWYDVMAAFPPKHEPTFKQEVSKEPLREILYTEDRIRAKFYQTYGTQQTIDLTNHDAVKQSICYRFIEKYQELERQGSDRSEVELFAATEEALASEGVSLRKRTGRRMRKQEQEAQEEEGKPELGGLAKLMQEALEKNQTQKT